MSINWFFAIELSLGTIIVTLILNWVLLLNKKDEKLISFYEKHNHFLSPDMISYYRMWGGIPVMILYDIGLWFEIEAITITAVLIFILLAIGDALDGAIARALGITSDNGARLDAKADKWFDLPALYNFCIILPIMGLSSEITTMYVVMILLITIFDYYGQMFRGKYSSFSAGIVGKTKTTIKFIVIYMLSLDMRYQEIYDALDLNFYIPLLLFSATLLSGVSMALKTKLYNEHMKTYLGGFIKKYLEEYFNDKG